MVELDIFVDIFDVVFGVGDIDNDGGGIGSIVKMVFYGWYGCWVLLLELWVFIFCGFVDVDVGEFELEVGFLVVLDYLVGFDDFFDVFFDKVVVWVDVLFY